MRVSAVIICDLLKQDINSTTKSLEGDVDEIVIVDTGEGGKTDYVYARYLSDDFSFAEARNVGIKAATGDYIFSIDSDEVLVTDQPLKEIINNNIVDVLYITIKQWHTYLNGNSEFQSYSLPRIFYKTEHLKYTNKIHESVSRTLANGFTSYHINPDICYIAHKGYDLTIEDMRVKLQRNVKLTMDIINQGEGDSYTFFHLGKLFGVSGNIKEQLSCYARAIELRGLNEYHKKEVVNYINKHKEKL